MKPGMNKKPSWLQRLPLHPFLFAVYPILALLAFNISEVDFSSGLRPLALSVLLAGILILVFYAFYRDWKRTALISTMILILFFSYGHIYLLLKGVAVGGFYLFRHRTLVPLWIVLAGLGIWWAAHRSMNSTSLTYTLNIVGLVLLIFPIFQLVSFFVQNQASETNTEKNTSALNLKANGQAPDIYYIILDGYGRSDILKNEYAYDNSDFLNGLRSLGFFIADCAQSNYAQTQISLASSLNFNYIDALSNRFIPGSDDRTGLDALIHHGLVRQSLEKAGYTTVAFATGFLATELSDADYFLGPQRSIGELNEFESLLMETTFARLLQDGNRFGMQNSGSELYRARTFLRWISWINCLILRGPSLFLFIW